MALDLISLRLTKLFNMYVRENHIVEESHCEQRYINNMNILHINRYHVYDMCRKYKSTCVLYSQMFKI